MKRWMILRHALLVCLPAMLLAGCEGAPAETDFSPMLDASFSAKAAMEYGDGQTASLQITRCANDLWEAVFDEPSTLAGVTLVFDGSNVTASYKGLEFTVPKSALPAKNMLTLVTEAVDTAANAAQLPCTEQPDGTFCYAADCEGGAFTLSFAESGEPLVFDLPAQPLKLTFSEYTCLTTVESTAPAAETTETAAETTNTTENNEGASA